MYASELTEIVNIDSMQLEILNLDQEISEANATNVKVYSKGQILNFVGSANDLFKASR